MSKPAAAPRPRPPAIVPPAVEPPAANPPAPCFTPVPVRPRRDGWTAHKQRIFIRTLAETGLVTCAARAAGMNVRSAHRLALRDDAESFCHAWDVALTLASRRGVTSLYQYALDGVTETVWRDGEVAYRRRRPSEKALFFLLSRIAPARFGAGAAVPPRDADGVPVDPVADFAADFDLYLESLHDLPPEEGDEAMDAADEVDATDADQDNDQNDA